MRRLLLLVVLALVAVPSASAKGPFQVCGASGCSILGDEGQPPVRLFGMTGGTAPTAPPAPAPYFVIKFADFSGALAYWVPSASVLRIVAQTGTSSWVRTLPAEDALLRDKTAGLTAFAAPTHVAAYVDYKRVKRSSGWLKLYAVGKPVTLVKQRTWYGVSLLGSDSPWTDGSAQIMVSRTGNYLIRDGVTLAIPKQVADRIRRRLPLG